MATKWQVCELEETSEQTVDRPFDRITVSAVPELWIVQQVDGTLMCFWPNKNAGRKIRTLQPPDAPKGNYYKCRILFNGEKFSSYKKARAAEIVAQNYSVMDCSYTSKDEEKLNSTMHFEVSDVPVPDVEFTTDNDTRCTIDGFIVSNDHDDDGIQIIGNDSSEFNRLMLRKPIGFEVSDLDDTDNNLPNVPILPGYNDVFKSNNEFLTSTAIDESECLLSLGGDNIDGFVGARVNDPQNLILAKIWSIEAKTNSFLKFIQNELQIVKGMLTRRAAESDFLPDLDAVTPPNRPNCFPSEVMMCDPPKGVDIRGDSPDRINAKRVIVLSDDIVMMPKESVHDDPMEKYSNEIRQNNVNVTFIATPRKDHFSINGTDMLRDQDVDQLIPSISETSRGPKQEIPEQTFTIILPVDGDEPTFDRKKELQNDQLNEEIAETTTDEELPMNLVLPIDTIKEYRDNEMVLFLDESWKTYVIDLMQPLADENEADYMNRTVFIVFTKNFLLNNVSWKAEANRVNLKHGNLLSCWKESYGKKFGLDEKNQRFQYHIRRLKSSKRAADKRTGERTNLPKKQKLTDTKEK